MLGVIRNKLRPLFLRRFRASQSGAREKAAEEGMTAQELRLYMAGFSQGWVRGALDASAISSRDLRPATSDGTGGVH